MLKSGLTIIVLIVFSLFLNSGLIGAGTDEHAIYEEFADFVFTHLKEQLAVPMAREIAAEFGTQISASGSDFSYITTQLLKDYLLEMGVSEENLDTDIELDSTVKDTLNSLSFKKDFVENIVRKILEELTSTAGNKDLRVRIVDLISSKGNLIFITKSLASGQPGKKYKKIGLKVINTTSKKAKFAVSGGFLPEGLKLKKNGKIKGKTKVKGEYTFTITATAGGVATSQNFEMGVYKPVNGTVDVEPIKISVDKSSADTGQAVTISYEFINRGKGSSGNTSNYIVLSADKTIDQEDFVVARLNKPNLDPGEKHSGELLVPVPNWFAEEELYIGAFSEVERVNSNSDPAFAKINPSKSRYIRFRAKKTSDFVIHKFCYVKINWDINYCGNPISPGGKLEFDSWVMITREYVYIQFLKKWSPICWAIFERDTYKKLRCIDVFGPGENIGQSFGILDDPKVVLLKDNGEIIWGSGDGDMEIEAYANVADHRYVFDQLCPKGIIYDINFTVLIEK